MELKDDIGFYTESEFLELILTIKNDLGTEGEQLNYMLNFKSVVKHPARLDLIFYPEAGADSSARGVLEEIKNWMRVNGKKGFKPELK